MIYTHVQTSERFCDAEQKSGKRMRSQVYFIRKFAAAPGARAAAGMESGYGKKKACCVPEAGAEPFQYVSGDACGSADFDPGTDGEPAAETQD